MSNVKMKWRQEETRGPHLLARDSLQSISSISAPNALTSSSPAPQIEHSNPQTCYRWYWHVITSTNSKPVLYCNVHCSSTSSVGWSPTHKLTLTNEINLHRRSTRIFMWTHVWGWNTHFFWKFERFLELYLRIQWCYFNFLVCFYYYFKCTTAIYLLSAQWSPMEENVTFPDKGAR